MNEGNALVPIPKGETALGEWTGAAARGIEARAERLRIIKEVLIEGTDYGHVPGTPEDAAPSLFKPGAEKVSDALNLWPDYEPLTILEDFDRPLFFYRYRCILRQRGTDQAVASGIGSCNSHEGKYRWRTSARKCPVCGAEAIIKGRDEYGGGWLCFAKKGGCGSKFDDGDRSIEGQALGRVENDDIATQVNTLDKMAQKRALVAANLALGFSEQFTQDIEDLDDEDERPAKARKTATRKAPAPKAAPSAAPKAAPKTVEQPKAKAEADLPPEGTWRGTIVASEHRFTKSNNREFAIVRGEDGVEFSTFSKSMMADADTAAKMKAAAVIGYKTDGVGFRQITSLDPDDVPTEDAAPSAEPSEPAGDAA